MTAPETLSEAIDDRIITILETRRKDLVNRAIADREYTYLLKEALVNNSMDEVNELLREIARDVVDCPWW